GLGPAPACGLCPRTAATARAGPQWPAACRGDPRERQKGRTSAVLCRQWRPADRGALCQGQPARRLDQREAGRRYALRGILSLRAEARTARLLGAQRAIASAGEVRGRRPARRAVPVLLRRVAPAAYLV